MEKTYKILVFPPTDEEGIIEYTGASYLKWNGTDTILSFVDKFAKHISTNLPVIIKEE